MAADDQETDEPSERRARLRARRRDRKTGKPPMLVSGKSVLLLKRLREERARRAARGKQDNQS